MIGPLLLQKKIDVLNLFLKDLTLYTQIGFCPLTVGFNVEWTNCFEEVVKELRDHYSWPSFLPSDSEASHIESIFIEKTIKKHDFNGFGKKAHLDFVERPSWQAVVKGAKKWTLHPPAECEHVCLEEYEVVVGRGDVLVIDTSLWYHVTKSAEPHVTTIALGSEFD